MYFHSCLDPIVTQAESQQVTNEPAHELVMDDGDEDRWLRTVVTEFRRREHAVTIDLTRVGQSAC